MSLGPITLGHYLSLGGILFALSVIGIFLNRRNLIVLLMAIELMLLAVNLNFVAFSHYLPLEADATKFAAEYGGKVLRFADIKADMVDLTGGALHDTKM